MALTTANSKASLAFVPALTLGIMCNALVCLAVWMCYSARTTIDRVVTIVPPICGIRRRRLRAQHRQHLFHPDGPFHQGRGARFVLEFDRQDCGGFSGSDLEQFSFRKSCSGDDRQHHRRVGSGRRRLLVCLFATAERAIGHTDFRARGMKWLAIVVGAAGLVMAATSADAAPRNVGGASGFRPDSVNISYGKPESADYQPIYERLKEQHALEKIRDLLKPLRLPHPLLLQTRSCSGISNAWSDDESVTVCYEFIDDIWKNVPEKTTPAGIAPIDALIGPIADVFLHETGHAVFAALKIPLFGGRKTPLISSRRTSC